MPRIAIAGFVHETNTFAPMVTPLEEFGFGRDTNELIEGDELLEMRGKRFNYAICGYVDELDALGYEIVPILDCSAEPAAHVTSNAFETVMAKICAGLYDNLPLDGVLLNLHGAMVFEPNNDGETEIIRRVKAVVGDVPVVVTLDLHGNMTHESFDLSAGMVGYRTYPHIDIYENAIRGTRLLDHFVKGEPVYKAFRQVPFLMPISAQATKMEPAKGIYDELERLEKETPDLLSSTVMLGFPPADIEDCGPSIFTYARSQAVADKAADDLLAFILARESQFKSSMVPTAEAVKQAIAWSKTEVKPVVLADAQDNAGGGATSDTPWLLSELVAQGAPDSALGLMYDPAAAAQAFAAGEGAEVKLELGGKLQPGQKPFVGTFKVVKLHEGPFIGTGPMKKGQTIDLGKMAHLQIDNVHVAVSSIRVQMLDQSYFTVLGIEPSAMKIVVVKSANHYRADFQPLASHILNVAAPGALVDDPAQVQYRFLREGIRLHGDGPVAKRS